ncbi:MAG: beta-lactamase family protein [Pricia sp.]|nr:beta-lactamase family protein [Pricia sp.]
MKTTLLLIATLLVSKLIHAQQEIVSGEIGKSVDTYLARTAPFGFSGAVLVANNGEVVLNKGYGFADRTQKIENKPNFVFSTGSLTKQFTAAAIMKLEMMEKLHTDDNLSDYFENLPEDKKNITLRHLLTHTSGLPIALSSDDFKAITRNEYLNEALNAELQFEPGNDFSYSNVGFTLLAMIIEDTSGLSYEEFLHKYFFEPTGMSQTGYKLPKWNTKNFVHIYNGQKDNGTSAMLTAPTWHLIGNGGILSTTHDMYKWVKALSGTTILSKKAKEKMFTPFKNDYGFGWDVLDGGNLRQHNGGSTLGNGAELRWFVRDELVTMIFTNSTIDGKKGYQVVRNELEALTMGDEIPMPPAIQTIEKNMEPYRGTYKMPSGATFLIEASGSNTNLVVESQELLDFLVDPENYKIGGTNVELNKKFEQAFSKALNSDDYSDFTFTGAAKGLEKEIKNELRMEGIKKPYFKILRTMPSERSKKHNITDVALNGNKDFEGESLLLHIVTLNETFVGLGVDFGFINPITLGIFPIGENKFQLYDLNAKIGAKLEIQEAADGEFTFTVGQTSISGIKKIN